MNKTSKDHNLKILNNEKYIFKIILTNPDLKITSFGKLFKDTI